MANNDCLWREATRFDANKPQASPKMQVIISVASILFCTLVAPLFDKFVSKKWQQVNKREEESYHQGLKADGLTPDELRSLTCYDKPAIMGDIFQEAVSKMLVLKALVFGAKLNFHVANMIQALIFGAFHMWNMIFQQRSRKDCIQSSIFAGVYFLQLGYVYYWTNSIWPCIILHIMFNRQGCFEGTVTYEKWLQRHSK